MPQTWADRRTLDAVRPKVRELLEASDGYRKLSPDERRGLAMQMVKVAAYLANPEGLATEPGAARAPAVARAQDDGVDAVKARLAKAPGFAGKDFQGGAIQQGTQQFGELVKKVDFPKFVSGLIDGVFKSIVDSSISQMKAYGELLANVAKTVDQFAQDNITANNSRDWLAQKYPDKLGVETPGMSGGLDAGAPAPTPADAAPKLVVKADDQEAALKEISADLKLANPITDLSDENEELRLVNEAKLQMARSRQQMLASMVMLGINRIVVTDGLIHAKVVFDMKASDTASRRARASLYDRNEDSSSTNLDVGYSSWFSPVSASYNASTASDHVTTVESSVDETSESKAQVKANLTGEVRVNFKSDYFPMDKLANPQMIAAIQGNAVPAETKAHAAATSGAPKP